MEKYIIESEGFLLISGELKATKKGNIYLGKINNWNGRYRMIPALARSYDRSLDTVVQIDEGGRVNLLDAKVGVTYTFDHEFTVLHRIAE